MDTLQSRVRRGAAIVGLFAMPLLVVALAIKPSLLDFGDDAEPAGFPSVDFRDLVLPGGWAADGEIDLISEAGGSLLLDGRAARAEVTHALSGRPAFELEYVSTHHGADASAPNARTGVLLRDVDGSVVEFAIEADDVGATMASVRRDDSLLAATPLGGLTAPRLRVEQEGDHLTFQVAPPGEDLITAAALAIPIEGVEIGLFAEGTTAVVDFLLDRRDPFVVEDGPLPDFVVVDVEADAGPDVRITDPDGDGIESLTFSGHRTTGDVVAWRWWLDGRPLASTDVVTVDVEVGAHDVLLEVESATGARDSHVIPVVVAAEDGAGSDDFSFAGEAADLDEAWTDEGSVRLVDDSGGSVLLEGAGGYASIERPNSGDIALDAGFVAVAPVEGLVTGVVVSDDAGDQLRFALEVGGDDVVRATVTEGRRHDAGDRLGADRRVVVTRAARHPARRPLAFPRRPEPRLGGDARRVHE